jgi:HlyD family secretion protein
VNFERQTGIDNQLKAIKLSIAAPACPLVGRPSVQAFMANKSGFRWWKWSIVLAVVGTAGGGGIWYFVGKKASPPQYQTAAVTRGDLTQLVTASGQLNPVLNVQVGSQISGRISKLYADFNSSVTQGQVIAEIDASTYNANVQRAAADLASARANLELAQVEARRSSQLFTNKLISSSDYDTANATLHQAEANTQIKQATLDSARVDLSRCTIYSPVDGVVISRNVDVGQTVAASLSAPVLFQIANDLAKMQIDAAVAEADVGNVEVGQDVEFTVDAFPYRTFHGQVTQVRNSPSTVQNVVTYDTVIGVNNADLKLKPGMTATVFVIVKQHEGVLKIPNAALRFRPPEAAQAQARTNTASRTAVAQGSAPGGRDSGGRDFGGGRRGGQGGQGGQGGGGRGGRTRGERPLIRTVYVIPADSSGKTSPGEVELKPVQVKLGISDNVMTEVTEGLNEGDLVVTGSNVVPGASPPPASNPFGGGGGFRRF